MSSYAFNNDLVGKDKPWGKRNELEKWQETIYNRYHHMCDRCNNPNNTSYKTYGAAGVENHFVSLSHYYNTLMKDPMWKAFKKNPDMYDIDKDIKKGHGSHYAPDTISIVLTTDNLSEAASLQGRYVVGIDPQGGYHEWKGCYEPSAMFGIAHTSIQQTCAGGVHRKGLWCATPHTKIRGKAKGWSFYWKDEYNPGTP